MSQVALCAILIAILAILVEAGITRRVNVDSNGAQANGWSDINVPAPVSRDGRYLVFESYAANLVSGDTNGTRDIFVHDRSNGATTRASVSSSGEQAVEQCSGGAISADGRFVVFESAAANLVPGDNNLTTDVFVHDRETGMTTRANVSSTGEEANNWSGQPSISGDGRLVAFSSIATNLVPGAGGWWTGAIFVHDQITGETVLASVDAGGNPGNGPSGNPRISDDGSAVVFMSMASNFDVDDRNGKYDVFVRDLVAQRTTRVSVSSTGIEGDDHSGDAAISADGRYVTFESEAENLVADDTNGWSDIFHHDRFSGMTRRVSVSSSGAQGPLRSHHPSISGDGRLVAFWSDSDNLVAGDSNNHTDTFMHDVVSGVTTRVSVDSHGVQGNSYSGVPRLSSDGKLVSFGSESTNLVAADTNGFADVFVHAVVELRLNGNPRFPSRVSLSVLGEGSEHGNTALVLLSCSGVAGLSIGPRVVPLTFDACTLAGLQARVFLTATVDQDGVATTPEIVFPDVPPGLVLYAAALTVAADTGRIVTVTNPIAITTE